MERKYFGTDGIRGRANEHPITAECALSVGMAAGRYFRRDGSNRHRVVIGKDTRRSCYMLENALTAGLAATGMNVLLLGPIPTPAVGLLTRSMRADLGVMISASHNPHYDNGIKFFGPDGFKLSDAAEREIEAYLESGVLLPEPSEIGSAKRIDDGLGRYIEYAKTTFPKDLRLNGLTLVLDCANGSAYRAAPEVLWELGSEVIPMGVSPNGFNINEKCGSTDTRHVAGMVRDFGADVGICLDGDADRVLIVDESGEIACGDQILGLFADRWSKVGRLANDKVIATIMSNLGLESFLADKGIALDRTAVGDRYVVEAMRAKGCNLGGEQSGHVVMTDYATTGDGLVAGLQFLAAMVETGKRASELARVFHPVPQILRNEFYSTDESPLLADSVRGTIRDGQRQLNGRGRLVVRKSGTEKIIRIMAECENTAIMEQIVSEIADSIRAIN